MILFVATLLLTVAIVSSKTFLETSDQVISLGNNFVTVQISLETLSLVTLSGNFNGRKPKDVPRNVLSSPFKLSISSNCSWTQSETVVTVASNTESLVQVALKVNYGCGDSTMTESWDVSVTDQDRAVTVQASGSTSGDIVVSSLGYEVFTAASSLYALYDRGVAQMMNNNRKCMPSPDLLPRMYTIGNGVSLEVLFSSEASVSSPILSVLHSSDALTPAGVSYYIIANTSYSQNLNTAWKSCEVVESELTAVSVPSGTTWQHQFVFMPNDHNFPIGSVRDVAASSRFLSFDDLQTYLLSVYGSPAGCLKSYYEGWDGTIAPTIAHPDTGYSPDTNFFDPDNFITLSALLCTCAALSLPLCVSHIVLVCVDSGDNYFIHETKKVLEKTAETMCGLGSLQNKTYCEEDATHRGQLMHHFVNLVPDYESIATSTQLGPNIFWTLTVIQYASVTGDLAWTADKMLPFIDASTDYILNQYEADMGLLRVPGPLWIDVLVRENYTSDSNAAVVYLFEKLIPVYDALKGEGNDRSAQLRLVRDAIIKGMNQWLWSENDDDHFITQRNPDGTTRDFIDYDSNLLAVAAGIVSDDRAKKILARVDSGPYTHVRGTWCCEVPYSGDADDCYIVGGTVCGDSVVTLARIGWVDSMARKRVGDVNTFLSKLLLPLQEDLLRDIWLYERYDENGTQIRTPFYFEYPAFVNMMLREIKYGINLGPTTAEVYPFPAVAEGESFRLVAGSAVVDYSVNRVALRLPSINPPTQDRVVTIHGLKAGTTYEVIHECNVDKTKNIFSLRSKFHGVSEGLLTSSVSQIEVDAEGVGSFSIAPAFQNCNSVVYIEN